MLENLTALAVAKVKAVGLVAGTALVTTALVGGGAVAVTVVSNERDQQTPAADRLVLAAEQAEQAALAAEQRSDTATAGIDDKGKPSEGEEQGEGCGDEVSAVASAKGEGTSGRDHGAAVSAAARTCNGSLDSESDNPGNSAGKGKSDEAGKPSTTGEAETAGRSETGPGSADSAGRPESGPGAASTQGDSAETEESGPGRPAETGRSAGKGGGRG